MRQLTAKIAGNKKIADGFFRMRLESAYLAKTAKPGQFIEVRVCDSSEPLLRRPLGVHRILRGGIELLYEVVGKGTDILSRRKAGEMLEIIGPLGNGFDMSTGAQEHRSTGIILVAGGIGVAPLLALAESLAYSVQRIAYRERSKIRVLIGAKTKNRISCGNDFKKLGCQVHIATDDGSKGHKGLVTELLTDFLRTTDNGQRTTIYACGPVGMLKAAAEIAQAAGARCQVSLEERMACGVGVCLGCPVKVKITGNGLRVKGYGYKMVCKDGPVFDSEEIAW